MIHLEPIRIGAHTALGMEASLPKTTLIAVSTATGYIMCGALDVQLLNDKLKDRGIIAGRAVGVRSLQDLLEAPLESVTLRAEELGIRVGMKGRDAVARMLELEQEQA